MTLPAYPGGVPYIPLREGFLPGAAEPKPLGSTMEGGNYDSRRVSLTSWTPLTFSVVMTQAQYATLETFMVVTLGNENSRYTMPVWRPTDNSFHTKEVYNVDGFNPGNKFGLNMVKVDFKIKAKNWYFG